MAAEHNPDMSAGAGSDDDGVALPSIELPDQVFDVQFHPHADLIATALINGQLNVYALWSSPYTHSAIGYWTRYQSAKM